jgi:hypothetical protein
LNQWILNNHLLPLFILAEANLLIITPVFAFWFSFFGFILFFWAFQLLITFNQLLSILLLMLVQLLTFLFLKTQLLRLWIWFLNWLWLFYSLISLLYWFLFRVDNVFSLSWWSIFVPMKIFFCALRDLRSSVTQNILRWRTNCLNYTWYWQKSQVASLGNQNIFKTLNLLSFLNLLLPLGLHILVKGNRIGFWFLCFLFT